MFFWAAIGAIEQKSLRLAPGFMTIGLFLVAWMESSGAQSRSCSSLGQTLLAESSSVKTLTSPNYPSDYDSNTDCLWTIETSQRNGYIVEVTFDDFRLESDNVQSCGNHDYLVVYDGLPQSGSEIGTFCGFMDTPAKVYSTGRYLSLRFATDVGFNYKGFKLSYFAIPAVSNKKKCFLGNVDNNNLELEGSSEMFQSPRYPLKYPKFINCIWVITVPEGKQVKLSFEKFDVEWSANCDEDYVKVFDGQYSSSTVKKTLCGSSIPDDVFSTGRHMRVQFSSDSDNYSNYGFKAQFEEVNPNVKIIGYVIGATVVFLLCFVIACVILRCRNAKRTADSSTALTSIQQPYPPPPQGEFQSNSTSSYMPIGAYPPTAANYPSQPPPPYSYPAESPPPYPGEENAPQYPPPGNMYPWQQQNEENNQSHVSA